MFRVTPISLSHARQDLISLRVLGPVVQAIDLDSFRGEIGNCKFSTARDYVIL